MDLDKVSFKLFATNVVNAGLVFAAITLFSRWIGPAQMGVFFLFEALLGLLSIPADLGLRTAIEKRLSEGRNKNQIFGTALVIKLLPLSIVSGAIVLFQPAINGYLEAGVAPYLLLALFCNEAFQLTIQVLKGELRVGETAELDLLRRGLWALVGGILVHRGWGPRGLIIGLIIGLVTAAVWGFWKQETTIGRPSNKHAHSLISYSKYSSVSRFGGYVYSWLDLAIIGLLLTQADVGAYEVAWRVTALVVLLSNSIAAALFPQASEWDAAGARDRIERILPQAITYSLFIVIPAFFGTLLLSQDILEVFFGTEYAFAWLVLIVLMAEKLFQAPHIIVGRALQAIDRPDLAAKATIVAVITNAVLNPLLILQWGLVGAAVATAVSFALNTALHAEYLSRFITIRVRIREVGWCILSSITMTIILQLMLSQIMVTSLFRLVLVVAFGAITYLAFVLLYPTFRHQFIDWITAFDSGSST